MSFKNRNDMHNENDINGNAEQYSLPSDHPLQNPNHRKDSPQAYNRIGRQKSRGTKMGLQAIPLQDKLLGCARIMPKQHTQDREWLYSQNMKLKEKARQLVDQNTRLKTRLSISEKEKQQIFQQADLMANSNQFRPFSKGNIRNKSQHQSSKHSIAIQPNSIAARRMFRDAKEEIQKLKNQNVRVKKSIKYTQISELQAESENLSQETARLEKYIREIINQDNFQEYELAIQDLKRKLHQEKQISRSFPMHLRKKDEELEEMKQKLRDFHNKKNDNQKRLYREISNLKVELSSLRKSNSQVRELKEKSVDRGSVLKTKIICTDCTRHQDDKRNMEKKINALEKELRENKQVISRMSQNSKGKDFDRSFEKSREEKAVPVKRDTHTNQNHVLLSPKLDESQDRSKSRAQSHQQPMENLSNRADRDESSIKDQSPPKQKKTEPKKVEKSDEDDNYGQENFDQQKVESKINKKTEVKKEKDEEAEYDDQFGQEQESAQDESHKKSEKNPKSAHSNRPSVHSNRPKDSKKKKAEIDPEYSQEFEQSMEKNDEIGNSDEQVLFRKSPKAPKKQVTKSQTISKVLKETISYKFMAQRYTFNDFQDDLRNSGTKQFSLEDIASMLSNEPFFLTELQQETLILHLFGSDHEIEASDKISLKQFLDGMKEYIGEVDLISEEQEKTLEKQIRKALEGKLEYIYEKCQKHEIQQGIINKKIFLKMLNDLKLKSARQIEFCLSEVSVCSTDMDNLSYLEFFQRFCQPQDS